MRAALLAAMLGLWAGAAAAVTEADVRRFVALSDAFHASLGASALRSAPPREKERHARCVLSRFGAQSGPGGVRDLLALMAVLSRGVAFDDRTVVAFNERYGASYRETVRSCRES